MQTDLAHTHLYRFLKPFAHPQDLQLRFHIIMADFYDQIAALHWDSAVGFIDQASRHFHISKVKIEPTIVPGALELPLALDRVLSAAPPDPARHHFYVVLGCVIRGATSHYDVVCRESTRGVMDVALKHRAPVGCGILTCETMAQAEERADPKRGNKAAYAIDAAVAVALAGADHSYLPQWLSLE